MRLSRYFLPILRETPKEAEIVSHRLMLRAGLIRQERRGRSLIYTADYAAMNALVGYLMENCCGGAACPPQPCGTAVSSSSLNPERKSA